MRIALVVVVLVGCATSRPTTTPSPRDTLPAVELSTLDGRTARLDDVTRGRPALVSFWATWCEACQRELDALARLHEATRGDGAEVVAVAVGEPRAQVADFVRRRALPYRQLVDERFVLADALGQTRVPATLVLDRDGRVVYRGGAFDEAALAALRAAVISATSQPAASARR